MVKVKEGEGDMKIHSFMKIIKDIEIKEKKVYFTTSIAIVLFIIIAGCVSTQPHTTLVQTTSQITPTPTPATSSPPLQEKLPNKTLRPVSVVSVQPGCARIKIGNSGEYGCSPGGPAYTLTLNASSTNVPVTHLSAMLILYMVTDSTFHKSVGFTFPNINQSNPLMPGQTASDTSGGTIGPVDVLITNGTTTVLIEGTLQNGQSFSYWTNDTTSQIIPTPTPATSSSPLQEKLPSKTFRPISVVASVQIEPSPIGPGGVYNPAGPSSWVTMTVNASSTDVPVIQLSTTVITLGVGPPTPTVCNFSINEKNPLMPGQNTSTTCGYRGMGPQIDLLKVNGTAAMFIEGTLQNGQSFSYWTNDTTS